MKLLLPREFTSHKSGLMTLFFLMLSICSYGQADSWSSTDYVASVAAKELQAQRVIPPAPEAAELGKYGNIPIGLFTGSPNISIPIFDIPGSRLKLPISMNYNSSGFKPQEIAGWVGLGWSLNAGGVITRSVSGNPDVQFNYYTTPNYLSNVPSTYNDLFANYDYMKLLENGTLEGSPDTYYYNFAGHTGKFFIAPDQSVQKKEKDNLVIMPQCLTCVPNTSSFTIVDEQGVSYLFSDLELATTALDDGTGDYLVTHSYNYTSSWYLTKMISADGVEEIDFNYMSPPSTHTLFRNFLDNTSITYSSNSLLNGEPSQYSHTSTPQLFRLPGNICNQSFIVKLIRQFATSYLKQSQISVRILITAIFRVNSCSILLRSITYLQKQPVLQFWLSNLILIIVISVIRQRQTPIIKDCD